MSVLSDDPHPTSIILIIRRGSPLEQTHRATITPYAEIIPRIIIEGAVSMDQWGDRKLWRGINLHKRIVCLPNR